MKRRKIICGLLLACSIMLGSLFVGSFDVSALKYAYNSFPLIKNSFYRCDSYNNGECNGYRHTNGSVFSISFYADNSLSYDEDLTDRSKASYITCDKEDIPRNYQEIFNIPSFYNNSFGFAPSTFFLRKINQEPSGCFGQASRWAYDSIYSAEYNMSNGDAMKLVDIPNLFFDPDDPSQQSGSVKDIVIPLGMDYDSLGVIEEGTTLEWDVGLVQKSANNFPYIDPNMVATMDISYFTLNPDTSSNDNFYDSFKSTLHNPTTVNPAPQCTIDTDYRFQVRSNELWEHYLGINVHCTYTAPTDMYYVDPFVRIRGSGSQYNPSKFLDYNYNGLYFSGSYLVTDGDDTWSGQYANPQPTGENLEEAPGYHQLYGYDDGSGSTCNPGDFLCELQNLFSFNFINPFSPIFSLFTGSSSCVQIPTIAGMIHSQETTVCPWFPANVREIVTPVLGLSSMMLIFGFAVRWLGSSSGNLFEDSSNETLAPPGWSGSWGRRKK